MNNLKLLIVDDDSDNRLVLRAICRKLEGFEIQEAADGLEAIDSVEAWHPHIILMDIMMPNMDGFEASKIIKERYPETAIIVVTAVLDANLQDKLNSIGVDMYISKPIDRELIRYKLQSVGSSIRLRSGNFRELSTKNALNPFNADIRSFRTFFDIVDTEAMMDFGMWLYDQYSGRSAESSTKFDRVVEVFYKLMSQGHKKKEVMSIIIEESYEEFYITMKCDSDIVMDAKLSNMFNESSIEYILKDNILCIRLSKPIDSKKCKDCKQETQPALHVESEPQAEVKVIEESIESVESVQKEKKVIPSEERALLHQSFVNKTSAQDYVNEIGGDVLEEIRDLASIDEEWALKLHMIEDNPSQETFSSFADSVLNEYVKAINNLFEFTALAYALSSLSVFLKESAEKVSQESSKVKTLVMLLEHLGTDLTTWREHVFLLKDTADIHYLDSSFFSSCMQIEMIISDKEVANEDDDDGMEFF